MKPDHDDFDLFWATFPRKVGKLDAKRAYLKARTIASAAEILDGVERYKRTKPDYADWCHPSTFLNKGRWMDEDDDAPALRGRIAEQAPRFTPWSCPHVPECASKTWCAVVSERERAS